MDLARQGYKYLILGTIKDCLLPNQITAHSFRIITVLHPVFSFRGSKSTVTIFESVRFNITDTVHITMFPRLTFLIWKLEIELKLIKLKPIRQIKLKTNSFYLRF